MDKIRKIMKIGSYDEANDELINNDGKLYVYFEDESIPPKVVDAADADEVILSLAEQQGVEIGDDVNKLVSVIEDAFDNGLITLCNDQNAEELETANAELEAAIAKADELGRGIGGEGVDPNPPEPNPEDEEENENENEDENEDEEELGIIEGKNYTAVKVAAGVLTGAALVGAGLGISNALKPAENNKDVDDKLNNNNQNNNNNNSIDFDKADFEEIMGSMSNDDARKVVAEKAMKLVDSFHDVTHKEGNFRLEEDGQTYLDLSFEEALVLSTFANCSEPEELYEALGSYNMTSEQAQNTLESARTKLITYYMNATEPSGLANLFQNEQDRAFVSQMESAVVNFNGMHDQETSDEVIRNLYYNYILDGSTSGAEISPMAKLLAFDTVYGGLILTESASVDHTQFLEFKGMGVEGETKHYIENVLHLDYSTLSEEEIAKYRTNIIEAGTDLVSLLPSGEVMNEENSTAKEREKNLSLSQIVDKMGLCNSVNAEITEKMQALDALSSDIEAGKSLQITTINNAISNSLREAGLDDLADRVDASITSELSADLLEDIRLANEDAAKTVENYEGKLSAINGANRPSMEQIVNAANNSTNAKENYAGSTKDVSTLINNRRHKPVQKVQQDELTEEEKKAGIIEKTKDGTPVVKKETFDKLSQEEQKAFIIEHGKEVKNKTNNETNNETNTETETIKEEVKYKDLTSEEKTKVEEQKRVIEAKIAEENASANGQISANDYTNASLYTFTPGTVKNIISGQEFDLNSMNFASAIVYQQRYGNTYIDSETGIIEKNGDFELDASKDQQILDAANKAADNYLNSISQEDKEAIAAGLGTTWDKAKETIKEAYKSGYISRVQEVTNQAIQEGNKLFAETRDAQIKLIEKNKASEQEATNAILAAGEEQVSTLENSTTATPKEEAPKVVEEQREAVDAGKTPTTKTEESTVAPLPAPEPDIVNTNTEDKKGDNNQVITPSGETGNTADEYDPNIGEQFQEGEELIEDANGNSVVQAQASAPVTTANSTPAAAPAPSVASEEQTLAGSVDVPVAAPAPSAESVETTYDEDKAMEEAIRAAFNALSEDSDSLGENEISTGGRRR